MPGARTPLADPNSSAGSDPASDATSPESVTTATGATSPVVSFVVPTYDEAETVDATLDSIARQSTSAPYETVVVDGGSTDGTLAAVAGYDAAVIVGDDDGRADGRNRGAAVADGNWLAFVDADTTLDSTYADAMLAFVRERDLAAASAYCRMRTPRRARLVEWTLNHVLSRLPRPVLPGFNLFVNADAFDAVDGFPEVPNEDTAFSRRLARHEPTGVLRERLVASSGRRVAELGLTGTAAYYLYLDAHRLAASVRT